MGIGIVKEHQKPCICCQLSDYVAFIRAIVTCFIASLICSKLPASWLLIVYLLFSSMWDQVCLIYHLDSIMVNPKNHTMLRSDFAPLQVIEVLPHFDGFLFTNYIYGGLRPILKTFFAYGKCFKCILHPCIIGSPNRLKLEETNSFINSYFSSI